MSSQSRQPPLDLIASLRRVSPVLLLVLFVVCGAGFWVVAAGGYADRLMGRAENGRIEDYVDFYAAGRLVDQGKADSLYDLKVLGREQRQLVGLPAGGSDAMPYSNPPYVALGFAPLAALPLPVAGAIVAVLGALLILAGAFALTRYLGVEGRLASLLIVLGFVSLRPVGELFSLGQLSMLLFFGWLGYVTFEGEGRPKPAGLSLALLLIKPQLAVLPLAALAWQRRWQTLLACLAAAALLAVVSLLLSGPGVLIEYPRSLLGRVDGSDHFELGHAQVFYGWNGFVSMFAAYGSRLHVALTLLFDALTIGAAGLACSRPARAGEPRFLYSTSALMLATLLINPHFLSHDLALLPLALAFTCKASLLRGGRLANWAPAATGVWMLLLLGPLTGLNLVTPLLAALLAFDVRRACSTTEEAEDEASQPQTERRAA